MNDARYKVSRIVKLVEIVEIVEIKVDCHFYFYYAFVGLYSVNIFSEIGMLNRLREITSTIDR